MRLSRRIKLFLLFPVLIFTNSVLAQLKNSYIKGAVELQNGQKLQGFIKNEELSKLNTRINFKSTEESKEIVVYDTSKLKSFRLEDGDIFELLKIHMDGVDSSMSVLAKLLVRGKASLYKINYNSDDIYIAVNVTKQYLLQNDKLDNGFTSLDLTEHYFRNNLRGAVPGSAISTEELERTSFREREFIDIISKYNKAEGSDNIVSVGKEKKTSFVIADIGGMYKNADESEMYIQAMYRIFIPKISRNSSLNIGIHYFRTKYSDITHPAFYAVKNNYTTTLISVPFQFQQNLLNKAIRPYIFAGLTASYYKVVDQSGVEKTQGGFQNNFGLGFSGGGGIEATLFKGFFVKGEYRYEIFSHLILAGIGYIFPTSKK